MPQIPSIPLRVRATENTGGSLSPKYLDQRVNAMIACIQRFIHVTPSARVLKTVPI